MENTLPNLIDLLALLEEHRILVYVFGGWAEEIWGMALPRSHRDIDLLYPADNFKQVDNFLNQYAAQEVVAKRFEHKRAFTWGGILVEIILVSPVEDGYVTHFFGNEAIFTWPADTFAFIVETEGQPLRIASRAALTQYRANHPAYQAAYQEFLLKK